MSENYHSMYTLDTNILIYLAAQEPDVVSLLLPKFEQSETLFLPTIVITEYLAYPELKAQDRQLFLDLIDAYLSVSELDQNTAIVAGSLRSKYGMKLADSIIAATAIQSQSTLVTRNIKDFHKVRDLKLKKV